MRHFKTPLSRTAPEASGDVISRTLSVAGLGHQLWRLDIFRRWPEAVGPKVAARTQPQSFSRGTLVVRAASSTWQNELMFLRKTIIARLNALLDAPRVTELKVISGHLPPQTAPASKKKTPPSKHAALAAEHCSGSIRDEAVREAFAQCMALALSRRGDPD